MRGAKKPHMMMAQWGTNGTTTKEERKRKEMRWRVIYERWELKWVGGFYILHMFKLVIHSYEHNITRLRCLKCPLGAS